MLHPSYTDLINAVNSNVEAGEQPVVQSRYSIVIAAAKRARQIVDGSEPMATAANNKALSIAVQELYQQKVSILPETEEEDEVPEEAAAEETAEAAEEVIEEAVEAAEE